MEINHIYTRIEEEFDLHLEKAREFLRLPSVSSNRTGLVASASWLRDYIEALGGQVDYYGKEEAPIIYARLDSGSAKTLLVYGMYDVHPINNQNWSSPPFDANIRVVPGVGRSIIARGACNSKGPLVGFLNAIKVVKDVIGIPVNLVMTFEGEEEAGSPTLLEFFRQHQELLKADAGFEPFWAEYGTDVSSPTIALGTKGILVLDLFSRGGKWGGPVHHPVHSSVGGWLASPAWRLTGALSTLVDRNEEICIKGFYDEVVPPSHEEEELLSKLQNSFDDESTLSLMGAQRFKHPLQGVDLLRKYLFSPSINIGTFSELDLDEIPNEVHVQLAIRLVPEMTLSSTIEKIRHHLDICGYTDIQIVPKVGYPWSRTTLKESVVQCMVATYRDFGYEPQIWPMMASSTPYFLFSRELGIPYVWGGLGRAGGSHAPDEYATVDGLKLLEKSISTFIFKYAHS